MEIDSQELHHGDICDYSGPTSTLPHNWSILHCPLKTYARALTSSWRSLPRTYTHNFKWMADTADFRQALGVLTYLSLALHVLPYLLDEHWGIAKPFQAGTVPQLRTSGYEIPL